MKKFSLICLLCLMATPAFAKDKIIFACTLTNHKQVLVTEKNNRYRYQFGKVGRPELVFENDKKTAIARSPRWSGAGREIWASLVLQNGDYFYSLYDSMDRLSEKHEQKQGVTITKSATHDYETSDYATQLQCNPKQKIVVNFPEALLF